MPQHKTSFYLDGFSRVAFCVECGKEGSAIYLEPNCEGKEKKTEFDKKSVDKETEQS